MAISIRTNAVVTITWTNQETGQAINLALVDVARVSVIDIDSETFLRQSENYLNSPLMTRPTNGKMKLYLEPHDTDAVGEYEFGDSQARSAYVRIAWGAESSDDISNPFSTNNSSRTVSVHHPSHGLSVNDTVFFETDTDVAGLDLADLWVVSAVTDSDHYEVTHRAAAMATVSNAGGTVTVWRKAKSQSATARFTVVCDDPT